MAKPIAKTPVFEGEDAVSVLKEMQETPTQDFIYFLNLCKD